MIFLKQRLLLAVFLIGAALSGVPPNRVETVLNLAPSESFSVATLAVPSLVIRPKVSARYLRVNPDEIRRWVRETSEPRLSDYLSRFREAMRKARRRTMDSDFRYTVSPNLFPERATSNGLWQDDDDESYWILKALGDSKTRRQNEMFAYQLAGPLANFAEIRYLTADETASMELPLPSNEYYLTRVVFDKNIPSQSLPSQDGSSAFNALTVAHILMRKGDSHLGNVIYAHGLPLAVDHEWMGATHPYPLSQWYEELNQTFLNDFLYHKVFVTYKSLCLSFDPSGDLSVLDYCFTHRSAYFKNSFFTLAQIFGFGPALIAAEGLTEELLLQSVHSFQQADIRAAATAAGFVGEEWHRQVHYYESTQASLGHDVGVIWRYLNGDSRIPGSFLEIDARRAREAA